MGNKVWKLKIKKSYIDFVFRFQQADDMARFLNQFIDCYQHDRNGIEIMVEVAEDEIKEDE